MPRDRFPFAAVPAAARVCLLFLLLPLGPGVCATSAPAQAAAGGQGVDSLEELVEQAPAPPEPASPESTPPAPEEPELAPPAPALPEPAGVEDLAWIAGRWVGEIGGQQVEEQWSAPAGGAMMGMFRWLREGKPFLYEHFLLESGPEGPVMHLRHFDPGSIAWEEKERPVPFTLVSLTSGEEGAEAVFEDSRAEPPVRLTYRLSRPDGLLVLLETSRQGRPVRLEFRYRRVEE